MKSRMSCCFGLIRHAGENREQVAERIEPFADGAKAEIGKIVLLARKMMLDRQPPLTPERILRSRFLSVLKV